MNIIQEDLTLINQTPFVEWEKLNQTSVLITGGNGMIPSYIAFALLYRMKTYSDFSVSVTITTRNLDASQKKYAFFLNLPSFRIIECDVMEPEKYEGLYDYIIHGASPADPRRFGANPAEVYLTNVTGTLDLLELAMRSKSKSFLYMSSGEVYGKLTGREEITEDFVGAVDPLNIRNCYAEGKRSGELLCKIWETQYCVPAKIVRLAHSFGPTMDILNDSRVFAEFVHNIINNENVVMKSNGKVVRPFCYLTDVVIGLLCVLTKGEIGEAYNLSGDEYWSIAEVANMLCKLFPEKKLRVVQQMREKDDNYLESESTFSRICSNKLKNLGWTPCVSVKEGFRRTILSFEEMKYETK